MTCHYLRGQKQILFPLKRKHYRGNSPHWSCTDESVRRQRVERQWQINPLILQAFLLFVSPLVHPHPPKHTRAYYECEMGVGKVTKIKSILIFNPVYIYHYSRFRRNTVAYGMRVLLEHAFKPLICFLWPFTTIHQLGKRGEGEMVSVRIPIRRSVSDLRINTPGSRADQGRDERVLT